MTVTRLPLIARSATRTPFEIPADTEFAPPHEGTEDPTHACFRRSSPEAVFGRCASGVANPVRSDGTSLLDEIWAGAPFATKGALVARARSTVASWVMAGLLSRADGVAG